MKGDAFCGLGALAIREGIAAGSFSARQVAEAHLERIKDRDPGLKAFLTVTREESLRQADAVDAKKRRGERLGRLAGVPVALKDNIQFKGVETTCASRILRGHKAVYHAAVVEKLLAEDAVIIGKTNLDEFAMGSSTENSAFFKTANPWNVEHVPGGSSGGSAAAVAAGLCALALGSDTGGSIRQPAAFCGLVGHKPSYGLVSRYGLVAFASSLDQIGPLARSVEDARLALSVIAGPDPRDSTSARVDPTAALSGARDVGKLKVGLPKEYFIAGMSREVEVSVRAGVEVFRKLGAEIVDVSLPHTAYAVGAYYIVAPSEASSNLARFDGVRYGLSAPEAKTLEDYYERTRGRGFGAEVKRRIMLGTYALSAGYYDAYYGKAQRVRTLIKRDFDQVFRSVDVLVAPTTPTPAFRIGEKASDPVAMHLSDVFTIPSNMAGNASVSIPCGLTSSGLPLGLQIIGPAFRDGQVLSAAAAFEKAQPFPRLAS